MKQQENEYQNVIFDYVDQVKDLLSPDVWQNVLLNCSKNELFVLWFLFRHEETNMSQIAEYIHVPLNTATGIISRMERRRLLIRNHSAKDKRVVTIALSDEGNRQLQMIMSEIMSYVKRVLDCLTQEESQMLSQILDKVVTVLHEKPQEQKVEKKVRKITIE